MSQVGAQFSPGSLIQHLSQLMRLWHFSSFVISFFKCTCAAVGLDVCFWSDPFVYFHTSCVRKAKALMRLRRCTSSPEPGRLCHKYDNLMTCPIYFFPFFSWSPQAIFILSAVAGLSSLKFLVSPIWIRAAFTASLIAPRTEAERSNGGSPTPWKYIEQGQFRSC